MEGTIDLRIDSNIEDADEDTSANPEHNICALKFTDIQVERVCFCDKCVLEQCKGIPAYLSWIQTFRSSWIEFPLCSE